MIYEGKKSEKNAHQRITITKIKITKGKKEYSNRNIVHVMVPYNSHGIQIINDSAEIEGCHIKGEELQFILSSSKEHILAGADVSDKGVQYIVGVKKSQIKNKG